ncbi:hypothetical protein BC938DRAFT_481233 [Jimgerdemannia flammicorona]|uniref:Uncharacterized protein n=1 Tax=Jimgerdemannia flammicorona TaxID=994334 RepID=A0A433QGI8_9FUNG|nr:hypothetical protein BC938DRAFT_481233 [Jimgerdemannia flammicorona]
MMRAVSELVDRLGPPIWYSGWRGEHEMWNKRDGLALVLPNDRQYFEQATGNLPCASETRVELFVHFGHTPAPLNIQFLLRHPSQGFNGFSVCHDLCGRVFGWAFSVYAGVGIGVDIGVEIGIGVEAGAEGRLPIRVEYEHGLRYRSEVEVVMDSDADIGGATAATLLSNDVPLPCPHHGGVRPDRAT